MSVIAASKAPRAAPRPVRRKRPLFNTTIGRAGLQAAAVVLLFVLWQAGVQVGWISDFLFGAPSGIYATFIRMMKSGELVTDTSYTMFEATLGFVIGTIAGSIAGLALWYSIFVARVVEPFIVAINSVPKIALAPIIILWFGTGLVSKVALAVSLTAIVALIAAYQAAKDADTDLQALLISMGATKHQIFLKAVVPSTVPPIIATFRINIGFGLVGAVVGEFISSQHGLGHLIYTASSFYDLNTVWVGLFVLMLLGFVLYYVIDLIERVLIPWKVSNASHQVQV
jgi:NitT/TauT family transport system permease protein